MLAGNGAAKIATCLILWVAFASVFSATLGYSRIPYAAAADGDFFKIFSRLHPSKNFPYVSLLFLGSVAFIFSLVFTADLSKVISAILAMRITIQFIGQAIGLLILRSKKNGAEFPYKMPWFPVPVILAIAIWIFILFSTGGLLMAEGLLVIFIGSIVYLFKAKFKKEWPFVVKG